VVLVDTSIWIRFLAGRAPFGLALDRLLSADEALAHDLVEGELLIGASGKPRELLAAYAAIHRATTIPHTEVVEFVRTRRLEGRGIGWIDAHLLASTLVSRGRLWTTDPHLAAAASALGIAHTQR
jgi:predicted nucleic acid-binding protein